MSPEAMVLCLIEGDSRGGVTPVVMNEIGPSDLCLYPHRGAEQGLYNVRQVVPYLILYSSDGQRVALFRRIKQSSGETACVSKISLGFGEHVRGNEIVWRGDEINIPDTILNAAHRSLNAAMGFPFSLELEMVYSSSKMIVSDAGIDKNHVGILYHAQLTARGEQKLLQVKGGYPNKDNLLRIFLGFYTPEEALDVVKTEPAESWTLITLQNAQK